MAKRLLGIVAVASFAFATYAPGAVAAKNTNVVLADPDQPDADMVAIEKAGSQIAGHQPEAGLQALEPIITRLEADVTRASDNGMVFCAPNTTEAILYAALPATQKKPGVVLGPQLCSALFYKAYALSELGRKDEAVATLERLTSLAPMNAHYFVELGYAYRTQGHADKSREAYQHAVEYADLAGAEQQTKRDRAAARRGLGYLLIDAGDLKGAEKAYRLSQRDDPDSPVAKSELEYIAKQRAR